MFTVKNLTTSFMSALLVKVKLGQAEPATHTWYRIQLAKLDKAAGEFPAAELRAHHLTSVDFTYHFVRAMKALYRWAADEDTALVPRDPFRKLKAPPCGERTRVLTRGEMVALYRASGRQFRRFLFLMTRTIARPGEIRGLVWGDIQWERRLITLKRFKGKKRRTDGVKVRTIPLDLAAVRLLRNLWERAGRPGPAAPVWLDRFGKHLTSNAVRCRMRRARERAGLDPEGVEERVVCYSLRHTSATEATRGGTDTAVLAKIMGHTRTATTNRYQHLAGNDLVDEVDRIARRTRNRSRRV